MMKIPFTRLLALSVLLLPLAALASPQVQFQNRAGSLRHPLPTSKWRPGLRPPQAAPTSPRVTPAAPPRRLTLNGASVRDALALDETDDYVLSLKKGQFAAVTLSFDVQIFAIPSVEGPEGTALDTGLDIYYDAPTGSNIVSGVWHFNAPVDGNYLIRIGAFYPSHPRVEYTITVLDAQRYAEYGNRTKVSSPTMAQVWRDELQSPGAAEAFYQGRLSQQLGPLVEPNPADPNSLFITFLYRPDENMRRVSLVNGPAGDDTQPLIRLAESSIYYLTRRSRKDGQYGYAFAVAEKRLVDGQYPIFESTRGVLDPLNPDQTAQGNSRLILPEARRLSETIPSAGPEGELVPASLSSRLLGESMTYSVYTPPGYSARQTYPVLVVFDGDWNYFFPVTTILDNLIKSRRIPPMLAVLVDSRDDRTKLLVGNPSFAGFVAKELLPAVRRSYAATQDPARTLVTGASFGGLCASYCGLSYPGTFGNVLSMSGSYWVSDPANVTPVTPGEGLIQQRVLEGRKVPVRFFLGYGLCEDSVFAYHNRHVRDLLRLKGYGVSSKEYPTNHEEQGWNMMLVDGLVALTGNWRGR